MSDEVIVDQALPFWEELAHVTPKIDDNGDELRVLSVDAGFPYFFDALKARSVFTLPVWDRIKLEMESVGVTPSPDEHVQARQFVDTWASRGDPAFFCRLRGGVPYTVRLLRRTRIECVWVLFIVGKNDYATGWTLRRAMWDIGVREVRFLIDDINQSYANRIADQRLSVADVDRPSPVAWRTHYVVRIDSRP